MPKTQMLINYIPDEECRIAIVQSGKLEEFYQERASSESHVGNIYKAKVHNIEPSIQAAFLDCGLKQNGFLHVSDLHPKYFPGKDQEDFENVGYKTPHRDRPPIQECLKPGDEVLVQVLKEGIGTKGPAITSYLSIPGRFLVMMPDMQKLGVTRKVEDDDQRRKMRDILKDLNPPKEFGFIVRTAGMGQTKADLKRDLAYLQRLWKTIEQRQQKTKEKVCELYAESDLIIRTIRDVFSNDIDRVIVDELTAAKRARDFLAIANPRARSKVVFYDDPVPLFSRFGIEQQIEHINARSVPLPSGGSLVIDHTEALVAIDVNSGKSRDAKDSEENAYKTDLEAADEICRQLRLRDLGGVIANDLIDMRQIKHRKEVEQRFRNNLKKDRARTRVNAISQFGILEMTRQRMRPSLKNSTFDNCPSCAGTGLVKSSESVVLEVMRKLAMVMYRDKVVRLDLVISPDVAFQLLNRKRSHLTHLEEQYNKEVTVRVGGASVDYMKIVSYDSNGEELDSDKLARGEDLPTKDKSLYKELGNPKPKQLPSEVEQEGYSNSAKTDNNYKNKSKKKDSNYKASKGNVKQKQVEAGDDTKKEYSNNQQDKSGYKAKKDKTSSISSAKSNSNKDSNSSYKNNNSAKKTGKSKYSSRSNKKRKNANEPKNNKRDQNKTSAYNPNKYKEPLDNAKPSAGYSNSVVKKNGRWMTGDN